MCIYNRMTDIMYFSWNVYVYIFIDYIDYMCTDFILFSLSDVFNVYLSISHTPFVYTQLSFSAAKHYSDKHIYIFMRQFSFHQSSIEGIFFSLLPVKRLQLCHLCLPTVQKRKLKMKIKRLS